MGTDSASVPPHLRGRRREHARVLEHERAPDGHTAQQELVRVRRALRQRERADGEHHASAPDVQAARMDFFGRVGDVELAQVDELAKSLLAALPVLPQEGGLPCVSATPAWRPAAEVIRHRSAAHARRPSGNGPNPTTT